MPIRSMLTQTQATSKANISKSSSSSEILPVWINNNTHLYKAGLTNWKGIYQRNTNGYSKIFDYAQVISDTANIVTRWPTTARRRLTTGSWNGGLQSKNTLFLKTALRYQRNTGSYFHLSTKLKSVLAQTTPFDIGQLSFGPKKKRKKRKRKPIFYYT